MGAKEHREAAEAALARTGKEPLREENEARAGIEATVAVAHGVLALEATLRGIQSQLNSIKIDLKHR